jgi:hypothetical protein
LAKQNMQTIKNIEIKDLRLWSENPRDPIDAARSDYDVIKHAIEDDPKKWNLDKLAKEMGDYYDFSEIPTVVYINEKPVVFDGNRRVAVLKYLQNRKLYASLTGRLFFGDGPEALRKLRRIPCNVCDKETALTNIERKHSTNGSWGILQREYFLNRHREQKKSLFLEIEERTGIISKHPKMNQRFVKDEVLTEKNLNDIGFSYDDEKGITTNYSKDEIQGVLDKVVAVVNDNIITTRNARGRLKDALIENDPSLRKELRQFDKNKKTSPVDLAPDGYKVSRRKTPITKQKDVVFGRELSLETGPVNDLYRAIYSIYDKHRHDPAQIDMIIPIVGMSLRLILDVAARKYYESVGDENANIDQLYKKFLKLAKKGMKQKDKNFLSATRGWLSDKDSMEELLAKYAHGNIITQKADVLRASSIVGDILEEYFKK